MSSIRTISDIVPGRNNEQKFNPATRNRTRDHLIAAAFYSQMLYQLSYSRVECARKVRRNWMQFCGMGSELTFGWADTPPAAPGSKQSFDIPCQAAGRCGNLDTPAYRALVLAAGGRVATAAVVAASVEVCFVATGGIRRAARYLERPVYARGYMSVDTTILHLATENHAVI